MMYDVISSSSPPSFGVACLCAYWSRLVPVDVGFCERGAVFAVRAVVGLQTERNCRRERSSDTVCVHCAGPSVVFSSLQLSEAHTHTHTHTSAVKLMSAPVTVVSATSSFPLSLTSLLSRLVFMIIIIIMMIFFRIFVILLMLLLQLMLQQHANTPVVLKINVFLPLFFFSSYS